MISEFKVSPNPPSWLSRQYLSFVQDKCISFLWINLIFVWSSFYLRRNVELSLALLITAGHILCYLCLWPMKWISSCHFQNLDLTKRKMVHEGPLSWKINKDKTIGKPLLSDIFLWIIFVLVLFKTTELYYIFKAPSAIHINSKILPNKILMAK